MSRVPAEHELDASGHDSGPRTSGTRSYGARHDGQRHAWEPPLAGTEAEHLLGALDRLRTTFRWKADDLDADGLQTRIGASALTLGGLLKHLAAGEDDIFDDEAARRTHRRALGGQAAGTGRGLAVQLRRRRPAGAALRALGQAVERSRARFDAALADGGLDQLVHLARPTAAMPACAGSCATSSRSTAATPGTPTCFARPWTDWSARTPAGWRAHSTRTTQRA